MKKEICIAVLVAVAILPACGGDVSIGGGGGSQLPTSAVMQVMTSAGSTTAYGLSGISGVGITVTFPPGVTVKTDVTGMVDSSAVVPSGVAAGNASVVPPIYTAATTTVHGKLDLIVASTTQNGFGTGEFVTINFIISLGSPTAGSFSITNCESYDLLSQKIIGMGSGFLVSIQ